jgi:hypothetical protein
MIAWRRPEGWIDLREWYHRKTRHYKYKDYSADTTSKCIAASAKVEPHEYPRRAASGREADAAMLRRRMHASAGHDIDLYWPSAPSKRTISADRSLLPAHPR